MQGVVDLHNSLVALLARHELGDHGAILLVDGRLVSVPAALALVVAVVVFRRALDLGQLDVLVVAAVVIWANTPLNVVVREHGVVEGDTTLWGVALALVLVVVDAVDVDDALVVVA